MKTKPSFTVNKLSLAIISVISAAALLTATPVYSQEPAPARDPGEVIPIEPIEVISVTGRLRSSASEATEERREQIAVADIMGSEQISRTGDSDAAAALRRVTGLTLKDGKFIYVRGLGERYSSTSLNGATVPSPDPTRNVVPLDMFPASIIESLSVQKSASANSPAAFGGGHVDIRTKSIPADFFFKASVGGRYNTNDSDDSFTYNGGGDDWTGQDDGTRSMPSNINNTINQYGGISPIDIVSNSNGAISYPAAQQVNRELALDMYRDMTVQSQSTDPAMRGDIAIGDRWDITDDIIFGALSAVSYKQQAENYTKREVELDGDSSQVQVENQKDIVGTDSIVQVSGMLNLGLEIGYNHKIETFTTYLQDTSDDVSIGLEETIDTLGEPNALQVYAIDYEERSLISNQIKGHHFIELLNDAEVNWKFSDARSERYAPNEVSYTYNVILDENNQLLSRNLNTQDAPKYVYSRLEDDSQNYAWDFTYPINLDGALVKLTTGYEYFERTRESYATRLGFDVDLSPTDANGGILASDFNDIFSDKNITDNTLGLELKDASTDTEDYIAAEKNDAAFVSMDIDFDDVWRVYAGIRYEDFRRVTLPIDPDGEISDEGGRYDLTDYVIAEDGWFPSLSLTWKQTDTTQWRLGASKTIVRPDLREVSPVRFQDPVTGFDFFGNPELKSSDIVNLDLRWEYYSDPGNNFSMGAFYKDVDAPIEPIQRISEAGRQLKFYNAESGYVYGLETEFLQELEFLGSDGSIWEDFFVAGNLTLGDSEIDIAANGEIDPTNNTRRMTGHSQWVANLQLSYDSPDSYHSATLVYNVFGERIAYGGRGGLDDVFEKPFHSLDFTYSFFPTDSVTVKVKAKNILGETTEYEQQDIQVYAKDPGTEYTLQLSYEY
ncbi:TonB-dependent receptor domain-containing protein [Shewanella psychromarinicola]|uniref:TonB-dependent receptor n=1 Tax=Shewanella psychromarinicola TaxID=2487742 RepID=A0A3N4E934_9GAMM|nr:TonB-dependent receptor [Shewanella psychromarinicola]AZG34741.1 TonB-dependent receptor [Shewanella psychromarinicola]MCL1082256.1 TonB-dependent receptor [Shewanella psychromarinicola]RPA33468.1 TonB-dependent receptor [Shewanella psychromarinicola]